MESRINLQRVKELRLNKGIPVKEIIEVLGLKTEAAYYKKENGSIRFSLEEAKKLSMLLNMPIEEIFFNDKVS